MESHETQQQNLYEALDNVSKEIPQWCNVIDEHRRSETRRIHLVNVSNV